MKMMKQLMFGALAVAMGIASAWAEDFYATTVGAFTLKTSDGNQWSMDKKVVSAEANQPLPILTQASTTPTGFGVQGWCLQWDGSGEVLYLSDGTPKGEALTLTSDLVFYPVLDYSGLSKEAKTLSFNSYQIRDTTYSVPSLSAVPGAAFPSLKTQRPDAIKAWVTGWYLEADGKGEKIYDAEGNACFSIFPRHDDLTLYPKLDLSKVPLITNTVSFASYVVNGKTYSVDPVKAVEGSRLPNLPASSLHPWLKGWYSQPDCKSGQMYDANGHCVIGAWDELKDITLYASIDSTKLEHNIIFADINADRETFKTAPMTFVPGETMANMPAESVRDFVLGWYTGKDGTGTQYFDGEGKPVIMPTAQTDVTLYANINVMRFAIGVWIDGHLLNPTAAGGTAGDGWAYDYLNDLVTFNEERTYRVWDRNEKSRVHFLFNANATVVASNLVLKTTNTNMRGCITLKPGVKLNIQLEGESQLDASGAAGVAGIYCPTGSSVKIYSTRTRDVSLASPTNMSYHGVLTQKEYATKDLVVKGGANAAAIGGRQGSDGGLSGQITIENCSLWATGGSSACDVGATSAGKTSANANDCGTIRFLKWPNVRRVSQGSSEYPSVFPNPHGDWETPVFAAPVWCCNSAAPSNVNVYWLPYGTTYLIAEEYTSGTTTTTTRTITVKHNAN